MTFLTCLDHFPSLFLNRFRVQIHECIEINGLKLIRCVCVRVVWITPPGLHYIRLRTSGWDREITLGARKEKPVRQQLNLWLISPWRRNTIQVSRRTFCHYTLYRFEVECINGLLSSRMVWSSGKMMPRDLRLLWTFTSYSDPEQPADSHSRKHGRKLQVRVTRFRITSFLMASTVGFLL